MLGALDLFFALGRDDLRVVQYCSWEGRPPCRPEPIRESLTGLSALGDSGMFVSVRPIPSYASEGIDGIFFGCYSKEMK